MQHELHREVDRMTKSYLRNVQQLAVFYTGTDDVYAINISKIKAFIIADEIDINDTPSDTDVVAGIATIRDEPILIVNLDKWLGKNNISVDEYKIVIYCEFNSVKVGFLVKDVIDIIEKTTDELKNTEDKNPKVTYVTEVEVAEKRTLCTVFNAEKLLQDIGWAGDIEGDIEKAISKKINSSKMLLIAEDSTVSKEILHDIMTKAGVHFEIHNNGQELLDRMDQLDPAQVGLVITDIEMPVKDGFQVVTSLRADGSKFHDIPIAVNSSMTTASIVGKMMSLGVNEFLGKTDVAAIYGLLEKYLEGK
jgi:two-component system chemotaxis response regulator CheV